LPIWKYDPYYKRRFKAIEGESMRITKEKLADLYMGYCIASLTMDGRDYCIAASEARDGKVVLIDCESKALRYIEGLQGGVMSIIPIEEECGVFIAIQKFYPVFASEEAQIVKVRLRDWEDSEAGVVKADVKVLWELPFVHRIALAGTCEDRRILAATLCRFKKFTQDWSTAGSLYLLDFKNAQGENAEKKVLVEEIFKNHGMYQYTRDTGHFLYVSGEKGVFEVCQETWDVRHILDMPVSDLCLFDMDFDGEAEMIAISPFHGDELVLLDKSGNTWARMLTEKISFGHAVWCGTIGSRVYIIACSRGDGREILLYEIKRNLSGTVYLESVILDSNVGATNIMIRIENETTVLYAVNQGVGEVARYVLIPD